MITGSMRQLFVISLMSLSATLQISMASAAERHRLAYSSSLGIEVFAWSDTGSWCQKTVNLDIIARDAKFFDSPKFGGLVKKIGQIIERECPAVQSASLKGLHRNNRTSILALDVSRKESWAVGRSILLNDPSPARPRPQSSQPTPRPSPKRTQKSSAPQFTKTTGLAGAASDHIASQGVGTAANCSDARLAAYRDAVQRVVGIYVDSTTILENYRLIKDEIINFSDGYVDSVSKISETKTNGGLCNVVVLANVRSTKLKALVDKIKPKLTKVSGVGIEAAVKTQEDKRQAAIKLLKKIVPAMPKSILIYEIHGLRKATNKEITIINSSWPRRHSGQPPKPRETTVLLDLQIKSNDGYLDSLFKALEPVMDEKTTEPNLSIVTTGSFDRRLVDVPNRQESSFFGLTNKGPQDAGVLEIGGKVESEFSRWLASSLIFSLGLGESRCDQHAVIKLYDKSGKIIWGNKIPIIGWTTMPRERRTMGSPQELHQKKRQRLTATVGPFTSINNWLPYQEKHSGLCMASFQVLSKGHTFRMTIPLNLPVDKLGQMNSVSAEPSMSAETSRFYAEAIKNTEPQ